MMSNDIPMDIEGNSDAPDPILFQAQDELRRMNASQLEEQLIKVFSELEYRYQHSETFEERSPTCQYY